MRIFYNLIIVLFLGMTVATYVHAQDKAEPIITSIYTNYPIVDQAVSLPNDATELDICVDSKNSHAVRFYSETKEIDSRRLIKEVMDPTDPSEYEMKFNPTGGFARKIIIEAISDDGTSTIEAFDVYKTIDLDLTDTP